MKTTQFLKVLFFLIFTTNLSAFAEVTPSTTPQSTTVSTQNNVGQATNSTNTTTANNSNQVTNEKPQCEKCVTNAPEFIVYTITYSPLLLFLFVFLFVFIRLKKEGYKISDALKENETIPVSVPNPLVDNAPVGAAPAPFVNENIQPKSSSRLIAFITALITLGIAASFCSFWLYSYLKCGFAPSLENITNVILALGLGVIPYAFNKISRAIQ